VIWWWSWVLTVVGVTGLYFAGKKRAIGWAIGIFAQTLWFTYAITTEQYGFLFSCLVYGWVYVKNFRCWRREAALA
jgi:nicotinamide riboside transporter PnuC